MSMNLEKEIQKLLDVEEIKQLKYRYGDMCDSNHDWTQIPELFAPDAEWVGSPDDPWGSAHGVDEIINLFKGYQKQMDGRPHEGVLGHNIMAPQIHVNDDGVTATGKWHLFGAFRMYEGREETGSKSFLEQGKYEDEYVKLNGRWYIKKLHFVDTLVAAPQDGWDDKIIQW